MKNENKQKCLKEEIKDWWKEHKKPIKTGVICLGAGMLYGFVKGVSTTTDMMLRYSSLSTSDDELVDDTLCSEDDPEWIELERLESESES